MTAVSGGYNIGSRVKKVDYHFENFSVFPGYTTVKGRNTSSKSNQTTNYNKRDEKAYYGYVNGGWIESINDYVYGGAVFRSVR